MLSEDKIEESYHNLAPNLTNYLIANGMDYASACDITQECFVRLWKKREIIPCKRDTIECILANKPLEFLCRSAKIRVAILTIDHT